MRSYPLRNIHKDQIDGDVWTIPAEAMKGRLGATSDFRVQLSSEAQRVIQEARKLARDGYLFPGVRKGVISDMTMSAFMKRQGRPARRARLPRPRPVKLGSRLFWTEADIDAAIAKLAE